MPIRSHARDSRRRPIVRRLAGILAARGILAALLSALAVRGQDLALEMVPFPGLCETSRAVAFVEDHRGRLWFCFQDRLQCHDGARIREIELEATPGAGPPANLRTLTVGDDDSIWVGCDRGVWHIPPGGLRGTVLQDTLDLSVFDLAADRAGRLWIRATRSLSLWRPALGRIDVPMPGGTTTALGVEAAGDRIWIWDTSNLWQAECDGDQVHWRSIPGAPAPIRAHASDGDRLVLATPEGAFAVGANGEIVALYRGETLKAVAHVAHTAGSLWFASFTTAWSMPRGGGEPRALQIHTRGRAWQDQSVFLLGGDSQGLLWCGTNGGMHRAVLAPGIENLAIASLDPDDEVLAMTEGGGRVIVGTQAGILLAQEGDRWRALPTPWPPRTSGLANSIEALYRDRDGTLFVGTHGAGVWTLGTSGVGRVGEAEGVTGAHSILRDEQGNLWLAGETSVFRLAPDGSVHQAPVQTLRTSGKPRPCCLIADSESTIWLGAHRDGLLRYSRGSERFEGHGTGWQNDSVLTLIAPPRGDHLWASSIEGLWEIDRRSGSRTMLHATARSAQFRSAALANDGSLWFTMPNQLVHYEPESRRMATLSPRLGAHPSGYAFRSVLKRPNGEIWFGANGGYSRVLPGDAVLRELPLRLDGVAWTAGGRAKPVTSGGGGHFEIEQSELPVRFEPLLVDRSIDASPAYEIVLRSEDGEGVAAESLGTFGGLAPGKYRASAIVSSPTGLASDHPLGTLIVRAAPPVWPLWFGALAAVLSTVGVALHRARLRRARGARNLEIERLLAVTDRKPEEVLDLGFLAAAVAEDCLRTTGAAHASVWIRATGSAQQVRIATFGPPAVDAEDRAARCRAQGEVHGGGVRRITSADVHDVLLSVDDGARLEVEILLKDATTVDGKPLALTLDPVRAALRRQTRLEQLEADLARRTASFEADAHDLRSPLTMLRMNAFELEHAAAQAPPAVQARAREVGEAVTRVLGSLDDMVRHMQPAGPLHLQRVDPATLVRAVTTALTPHAAAKSISLEVEVAGCDDVVLDPTWYGRAIENLIGNALKFSPRGSLVRVRGEVLPTEYAVHIDDAGPGFSATERETVFLPGITGSAAPTGGETKSGMGLWIARQALRSMGGKLWIGSRPGPGARVSCTVPRLARPR